ncbi:MAG: Gfo/Idh/MocA family oxidoreductase [Planctomycetes bacterium]|nr:Gfo/Idh/MocA family oxidoreductase [Planctomycetota bacterium]
MINCCVIGVTGFGDVHYKDLLRESEAGNVKVVAATIINQDEVPEKCEKLREMGCEIFTDYKEMLAKYSGKADLCCIPTGIYLHAPMTIAALNAGMNVLVEKPVAATVQEVKAMQEAVDKNKRFAAVGYQSMYTVDCSGMKKAILDGKIGKVKTIKACGLWPRNDKYYGRNNWAGKLRVGENWVMDSPYNNAIAHQLNMLCFLPGKSFEKSARLKSIQAELYRGNQIESADTAAMRIITEDGIELYFIVSHCSDSHSHPDIHVIGEKGKIVWEFHSKCRIEYNDGTVEETPVEDGPEMRHAIYTNLIDRIEKGEGFICDLSIAGTQTLCVNGAHESCPVRYVGDEYIKREPHEDSTRTIIKGLDEIMLRCFEENKLFSEVGAPWAKKSEPFSLENYENFSGPASA